MASNFPTSLDSFTNPSATDAMDSVTVPHATQHADLNDAVESLQAKVGVDGSAVTGSLDYKVAQQGLTLVKSQTIGTAVSSVTVSNAFSTAYDSYKIIFDLDTFSVNNAGIQFTLGSTTNLWYGKFGVTPWNGSQSISTIGAAYSYMLIGNSTTTWKSVSSIMEIVRPYYSARSQAYGHHYGNGYVGNYQASEESENSHSSFSVAPSSGTMTGGTIYVYGYGK